MWKAPLQSKYITKHFQSGKLHYQVSTDPEVYYYTSGMLNGLHGTIGTVNRTLNGLHRTIGTVNGLHGTVNGLHGTVRTENRTLNGLHGTIQ
jgi:hypothetical protein